jgi:ATP-dependent DNA helicase RecQ
MIKALRTVFGFEAFRPNQEEIIRNIMTCRDVFAVMPTGGGKSLCYQLPAWLLEGTAVVISPLISLMKDQVDAARENGIPAAFINSSMSQQEISDACRALKQNRTKLLYIAPERFAMPDFLKMLKGLPLSLLLTRPIAYQNGATTSGLTTLPFPLSPRSFPLCRLPRLRPQQPRRYRKISSPGSA